ncbi:MAG TPA: hypothetical protein VM687_10785 [Stenotrophomonas sp.]|nr:hypothetical protein [Stenotrophomonas sp.]
MSSSTLLDRPAHSRRARLSLGIATALLCAMLPGVEASAQEAGRIGAPDSWKSVEFQRDGACLQSTCTMPMRAG